MKIGVKLRLKDGRQTTFDELAKCVLFMDEVMYGKEEVGFGLDEVGLKITVDEIKPHEIIERVESKEDLAKLKNDLATALVRDPEEQYWKACFVVCEHEIQKRDLQEVESSVFSEICDLLDSKTLGELNELEISVEQILGGGTDAAVDMDYWAQLKSQLAIYKARAKLKEFHQDCLERFTELDENEVVFIKWK